MDTQEGSHTKDMYVAVRVGDVQKLSKVGASKSYKFPANAAKGRRYGKIELFRRIGSSSISIDQENAANIQEVTILDKESPFSFQVHLANGVDVEKPAKKEEDNNPKVAAAKAYLDKHHLELRLAEAMQSVLRERPDDPAAFVAAKLQSNAGMVHFSPKVAPPPEAAPSPKVEVVMLPFKTYYAKYVASLPTSAWDAMYAKFPRKAPPRAVAPPIVPCAAEQKPVPRSIAPPAGTPRQEVSSTSFGDYYRKNFKSCLAKAWDAMYAQFPSKKPGVASAKAASPTPAPKSAPTSGSFSDYYRVNFAACPPQAWIAMYKKFPSKAQAAAAASTPPKAPSAPLSKPESFTAEYYRKHCIGHLHVWEGIHARFPKARVVPKQAAVMPEQVSAEGWQKLASVGTWCSPRLFRGNEASAANGSSAATAEVQKPEQNFQQLSSVGTWCAPRLFREEASAGNEASAAAPGVEDSHSNFVMQPSVGTWCAPLLQQAAGEAVAVELPASPSHLRPSVGTWLMSVPLSDKAPISTRKRLHMIPMSIRYGAAFHSCGVRPAMSCL